MQFHPLYDETVKRLEEALNSPRLFVFGRVNVWLEHGATPDLIVDTCANVAKRGRWSGSSLNYFDGFIADAVAALTKPMPKPSLRVDRDEPRKVRGYEPTPELPPDIRDKIERGKADMLNKGMTVMSVTYQDAQRMKARGWLSPEAAERLGLV